MNKLIALIQLYSVQVLGVLATLNTILAQQEVPWWITLIVNVIGLVVGTIVRDIPQPKVAAKLQAARFPYP